MAQQQSKLISRELRNVSTTCGHPNAINVEI